MHPAESCVVAVRNANKVEARSFGVTPPTLHGYLLGYPVVYAFDDSHRCVGSHTCFTSSHTHSSLDRVSPAGRKCASPAHH